MKPLEQCLAHSKHSTTVVIIMVQEVMGRHPPSRFFKSRPLTLWGNLMAVLVPSPEICSCPQPHTQTLLTCKGSLGGGGI